LLLNLGGQFSLQFSLSGGQ